MPIGSPVTYTGTPVSITTTALPVGTNYALSAVYTSSNSPPLFTSTGTSTVTVDADPTTTTVTSSDLNNAVYSEPLTVTATVQASLPGGGTPSGSVVFKVDGNAVSGSLTLDGNGQATFVLPAALMTATGSPHTIEADYTPDGAPADYQSSVGTLSQKVAIDGTSTAVTASTGTNTAVYGQTLTLTASVTAGGLGQGIPTGSVQFFVDGTPIPAANSPVSLSNGVATLITTAVAPLAVSGSAHTISATYTPDTTSAGNFNTSTGTLRQTVSADPTTTTVLSSTGGTTTQANPAVFGQTITFLATVAPQAPGTATPTGSVQFTVDGSVMATVALGTDNTGGTYAANVAGFVTSSLSVASHNILVQYLNADGNFSDSDNSAAVLNLVVNGDPTTTTVSLSATSAVYSAPVTLFATVAPTGAGSGTPTGTVTFFDANTGNPIGGAVPLGTNGNAANVASLDISTISPLLNAGTYNIKAVFTTGDNNFGGSDSSTTQTPLPTLTITQDATTTSVVTSSDASAVYSEPVTLTAIITPATPGTAIQLGSTVNFQIGTTVIGSGAVAYDSVNSDYYASYTTSTLTVGSHLIKAQYVANPDDGASTSPTALTQVVGKAQTSVALTSSNSTDPSSGSPSVFGQTVTFTAVVTPTGPASGTPTGTVTFRDNGSIIPGGSGVQLINGQAVFATAALNASATDYTITAVYSGTAANFAGNTSPGLTQTVQAAQTTIAPVALPDPAIYGKSVVLTATVTPVAPGGGTPTGTVTFQVDGNGLSKSSTVSLGAAANGKAVSAAFSGLAFGQYTVTVSYHSTSNNFTDGGPTSATFNVNYPSTSTISVPKAENPVFAGTTFTLTATVAPGAGTGVPQVAPTGAVNFLLNGTTVLNGATPVPFTSLSGTKAIATFPVAIAAYGTYHITVQYVPDNASPFAPSTSTALTETIYAVPASITAHLVNIPRTVGALFTVTARLFDGPDGTGNRILLNNGTATISEVSGPANGFRSATVRFNNRTGLFTFSGLRLLKSAPSSNPYVLKIVYNDPTLNLAPAYVEVYATGRIS